MNDAAGKNEQHIHGVIYGRQSAWIVLVLGLVITAVATLYMKSSVDNSARQEFASKCNDIKGDISERLADHARILRSGASFFDASDLVTRKDWHIYADRQNLEQQLPGIQGLGFSLLIPREQLAQHTRQIRSEGFMTPAVMLTMSDSETDLTNAIRAGVRGYLLKDMAPDDVVDAIRRVAGGELVVAPTMTLKLIEMLRGDQPEQEPKNSMKLLTEREREILQLLSRGESNKAIAQTLKISYDTVKQHVRHILNKLNLSSRVKAAVLFTKEQESPNSSDNNSR